MEPRRSIVRSRIGTRLVHPGEILWEEFMRPFWISQNALARCIGVSPRRINEIVNGKRSITAATALGLGEALGPSAHFWMALQSDYDLEMAIARQMKAPEREHKPLPEIERSYDLEEEGLDSGWLDSGGLDSGGLDPGGLDPGGLDSGHDARRHDPFQLLRRRPGRL